MITVCSIIDLFNTSKGHFPIAYKDFWFYACRRFRSGHLWISIQRYFV